MISIRSNFFYTRSVPCELWPFDRAKPPERKDKVLMLDARNIYRKVARDWSLTPGRYVGVSPPEEDEDFDFEQTLRDIHTELSDLNKEAVELAAKIQTNFEELGI
jgi:type I restriction-modification system DNA methylase subunit